MGEGGCGKTWIVTEFIVPATQYAFQNRKAIKMIAFSNPQAANLSTETCQAVTVHKACFMKVQVLCNKDMVPKEETIEELANEWNPVQVNVLEEAFLCPAEGYNMGMLRSAWGTHRSRDFIMDDYASPGKYWGASPLNLMLGDPLQLRPVRAISLLDTAEMLAQRIKDDLKVSTEAQIAIRCFRDLDLVFVLTETKRFLPGDPLPLILTSMRNANPEKGITMDPYS